MVMRMTGPGAMSAGALAKEVGVPQPTLSRWLLAAKVGVMPKKPKGGGSRGGRPKRWTPEEKLRVVMEAAAAGEAGLGELLRREGLHEADLDRFRQEVQEAALEGLRGAGKAQKPAEDTRVKELQKELRRKEKALAEAAALLVLRKKVQALWGEEGDDTDGENEK